MVDTQPVRAEADGAPAPPTSLAGNWKYVLATTNPPPGRLDPVSKWLYLTRAGVLPMTLVAAAVAGLLAVYRDADVAWGWFALAAVLRCEINGLMPASGPPSGAFHEPVSCIR